MQSLLNAILFASARRSLDRWEVRRARSDRTTLRGRPAAAPAPRPVAR